jgi:hypothetical protein
VQVGAKRRIGLRADACSDDVLERGPEGSDSVRLCMGRWPSSDMVTQNQRRQRRQRGDYSLQPSRTSGWRVGWELPCDTV